MCNCEHGSCDHVDGSCHCENGWTGQSCEVACPKNCLVCREDICMSCKAGWTGKMCSNKCEPGLHGVLCEELCPECNCTTSCHHVNGSCPDVVRCENQTCKYQNVRICMENPFTLECLGGWAGHLCLVRSTMTTTKDILQFNNEYMASDSSTPRDFEARMDKGYSSLTVMLVFLAVVAGVVNGAVIVTLWYCVKRCTRSKTRGHNNDEMEENVEMEDYQSTGNTFSYENIPRGSAKQNEEYQHLDFTYSQYQRLDTSSMDGSCTYISMT
ncbi:uncharacterized protein [Ptychodera flava]|uniref:uncharacterized protein n=1 Tax=Ptychodera flava TaxID=63121 RepID=UPI00396A0E6F